MVYVFPAFSIAYKGVREEIKHEVLYLNLKNRII